MDQRSTAQRLTWLVRTVDIGLADRVAKWAAAQGLTQQQSMALGFIEAHQQQGVSGRELAERTRTTPASVTSLLQGLEARGLIERTTSPTDSRVKLVTVTPAGAELIAGFGTAMRDAQDEIFAPLDPDEQATLERLLERVAAPIDLPERPGPTR